MQLPYLKDGRLAHLLRIRQKLSLACALCLSLIQAIFLKGGKTASIPELSLPATNAVIRIAAGRLSSLTFPHTPNSRNLHSWGCLTSKQKDKVQLKISVRRTCFSSYLNLGWKAV